jgi:spore coat polysaccharide biosynthesis protein SpsF
MSSFGTDQERFWAGEFGDEYVSRNRGAPLVASNRALFASVLRRAPGVSSALELGANIGQNLIAIRSLLPAVELAAVEINAGAANQLRELGSIDVHQGSLLDFSPRQDWDFVFTKGVLIHLAPERITEAYDVIYGCSRRYVGLVEYYSPAPVEVTYRGHDSRLFKRDFAGEMLDRFPDLKLVDYGFVYHRDPVFPLDDTTWFLLERS